MRIIFSNNECIIWHFSNSKLNSEPWESDSCHAYIEYLGYEVGLGHVTPIMAKVEAIAKFPISTNLKK